MVILFRLLAILGVTQTQAQAPTAEALPPARPGEWRGSDHCWVAGYSYDKCCEGGPIGTGDETCWIGEFTYRRCCMSPEVLRRRSHLANYLVGLQGDRMSIYQEASHVAATDGDELMSFRHWDDYDKLHDERFNLWVARALAPAWQKSPAAIDCYAAAFTKARFWPKLKDNWDNSAAAKLDGIGGPTLYPLLEDKFLPYVSAEIATHLGHLASIEELLYDENGQAIVSMMNAIPNSITEVGGGFGAAAILALDLFEDLERYVVVDLPQPLMLVRTLARLSLPDDKLKKLHLVDATDPNVESVLDSIPTKFFLSCSAYSELHPALRRRYYDTIIQKADFGMIIDNSYLQWSRGMFDLNSTHSGGVGGWMNLPGEYEKYGSGAESRNSPPVRAARDALVGFDLMHRLMTSYRAVDFNYVWREYDCVAMSSQDMAFIIKWSLHETMKIQTKDKRVYASDEFFLERDNEYSYAGLPVRSDDL